MLIKASDLRHATVVTNTPDSGAGGFIDLLSGAFGLLILADIVLAGVFGLILYLTWPNRRKK